MPDHSCDKCGRIFQQKSHLTDHMNKKNDCAKTVRPVTEHVNEVIMPAAAVVMTPELIALHREQVEIDFRSAEVANRTAYLKKNKTATTEYIFPNQREDAAKIVDLFYKEKCRIISIIKKTKVGMNGLMIEIARRMTTHPDDDFVINLDNVRFLTGMSNSLWEKEFKESVPKCFKDNIFHHGQLGKADLLRLRDSLIFIDEIDTGDKEGQVLHQTLKDAGLMNIDYMQKNNVRFIVASASIIKELYSLYPWGDLHKPYTMTIPANYIGHYDFLQLGIIKEFYSLISLENAELWIQEDILDNYGTDFRVHIVRVNARTVHSVQNACIRKKVKFHNHTSTDKLSEEEIKELFEDTLTEHHMVAVKGLWRRANLFVDSWKIRIGATHELWTKKVDSNVQNQGLPGRLTGYWRSVIEGGHKTGPYRTSIKAIEESQKAFEDPFGAGTFTTNGFHKSKSGKVSMKNTMLHHEHWNVEKPVDLPILEDTADPTSVPIVLQITAEDFSKITKSGRSWNISSILEIIKKYSNDSYLKIKDMEKNQVVCPEKDESYDKLITAFVKAFESKTKYTWANGDRRDIDTYQIYLDNRSCRIIISIYYGSKNST